jgi:hypothetical protein
VSLPRHIAVVSLTQDISTQSLLLATAALQKQVTRDFTPIWGVAATVDAFPNLQTVPNDYHHVVVFGDPAELAGSIEPLVGDQTAARLLERFDRQQISGIHMNVPTRQPFALVSAEDAWTVVLSHEVLEMLADPSGNHLIAAAHPTDPAQRVRYLIEICDPCQAIWYPVNGVPMADFYTPRYFDPVEVDGVRYSFTGSIRRPRQILEGGYLTFVDPTDSALYQIYYGDTAPVLLSTLADLALTSAPLRTLVDGNPRTPRVRLDTLRPAESASAVESPYVGVSEASQGSALTTVEAVLSIASGAG